MITVGTNQISYPQLRNFIQLPYTAVQFKRVGDYYRLPSFLKYKLTGKTDPALLNRFNDFGFNRVDLYHFFNVITPVRKPWIVTYETSLPRLDPDFRKGYHWMASDYCKAIIAFSGRAVQMQEKNLEKYPALADSIRAKIQLLHPAQKLEAGYLSELKDDLIHLVFVGRTFYGKGGYQLLKAYEAAKQKKLPIRLSIVSSLTVDGFRDGFVTKAIQDESRRLLDTLPDLKYYPKLSGTEIATLLQDAQVGILPSFSETYGYFLLEAMSCGCAIVRTAIMPFDEIAPEACSYSVSLGLSNQQTEVCRADLLESNSFRRIHSTLIDSLIDVFEKICANPEELYMKRTAAIQKIKTEHDPMDRAEKLEILYNKIKKGQL